MVCFKSYVGRNLVAGLFPGGFAIEGCRDCGLLLRLVFGVTARILGQRLAGQHEEIVLLGVEDHARLRHRFLDRSRLGDSGG